MSNLMIATAAILLLLTQCTGSDLKEVSAKPNPVVAVKSDTKSIPENTSIIALSIFLAALCLTRR